MKKIQNVLFDLDGTLLNSIADITYCVNTALKHFNIDSVSVEDVAKCVGAGWEALVQNIFKKLSEINNGEKFDNIKEDFKKYYMQIYLQNSVVHGTLYTGVLEGLEKLYNNGLNLYVVSNKPHSVAVDCIDKLGIKKYFKKVIGDGYYNTKKPEKELWQKLKEEFKMDTTNTIMVVDGTQDIDFAHNSGIEVLVVLYGGITEEELLINKKEKNYFKSFNSIAEYILKFSK